MNKFVLIVVLFLCFLFAGCSSDHNGSADVTAPSVVMTEPVPEKDERIDIAGLKLSDLRTEYIEKTYVMLVSQNGLHYVYRIYSPGDDTYLGHIERYETEEITSDFLRDGSITVNEAIANIFNIYDYYIFGNRYYALCEDEKTVPLEDIAAQWEGGNAVCILCLEDEQGFLVDLELAGDTLIDNGTQDMGLFYLMQRLFEDRGINKQHFGPERS